jgi:uncharacterized membrane-anchored protein YhcB (DUF1043 family)
MWWFTGGLILGIWIGMIIMARRASATLKRSQGTEPPDAPL